MSWNESQKYKPYRRKHWCSLRTQFCEALSIRHTAYHYRLCPWKLIVELTPVYVVEGLGHSLPPKLFRAKLWCLYSDLNLVKSMHEILATLNLMEKLRIQAIKYGSIPEGFINSGKTSIVANLSFPWVINAGFVLTCIYHRHSILDVKGLSLAYLLKQDLVKSSTVAEETRTPKAEHRECSCWCQWRCRRDLATCIQTLQLQSFSVLL